MKFISGLKNSHTFYSNLAIESGYNDLDMVKNVYRGIMRMVARDLKDGKEVELPGFGKFRVIMFKERNVRNIKNGETYMVKAVPTVKFKAYKRLKEFVRKNSILT